MHTLIDLPYAPDALEPVISARTLEFHHGKHLQAYVDNLNKLIAGTPYESMSLEEIVMKSSLPAPTSPSLPAPTGNPAIFNNAGQVLNHNMYFTQFKTPDQVGGDDKAVMPDSTTVMPGPTGHLKVQIEKQWGTLDAFKAEFEAKGVTLFGSGWVWLAADQDGTLSILQCPNAGNPITAGLKPMLTFDVWEHAYYLDYQNRRAAQLNALWGIVDWKVVEERYY